MRIIMKTKITRYYKFVSIPKQTFMYIIVDVMFIVKIFFLKICFLNDNVNK